MPTDLRISSLIAACLAVVCLLVGPTHVLAHDYDQITFDRDLVCCPDRTWPHIHHADGTFTLTHDVKDCTPDQMIDVEVKAQRLREAAEAAKAKAEQEEAARALYEHNKAARKARAAERERSYLKGFTKRNPLTKTRPCPEAAAVPHRVNHVCFSRPVRYPALYLCVPSAPC